MHFIPTHWQIFCNPPTKRTPFHWLYLATVQAHSDADFTMTTCRQFHQTTLSLTALGTLGILDTLGELRASDVLAQTVDQVKICCGIPARSADDGVARRVGEKLVGSAHTKNTSVVENKAGAGGRIGADSRKGSPADGSALAAHPLRVHVALHRRTARHQQWCGTQACAVPQLGAGRDRCSRRAACLDGHAESCRATQRVIICQ